MIKTNKTKLSPRVKQALAEAREETKELNRKFFIQLREALKKRFAKTDTKVKEKFGNLKEELEAIASQKKKS